jgi:hypothetical protein
MKIKYDATVRSVATDWAACVRFPGRAGISFLATTFSLISSGYRVLYSGVKQPAREARHSPPSSDVVKNAWSYTSTPHSPSWRGA